MRPPNETPTSTTGSGPIARQASSRRARSASNEAWSGGALAGPALVGEQYLLDLEREAFLSLCAEPKTLARIKHTLDTGKPLRN